MTTPHNPPPAGMPQSMQSPPPAADQAATQFGQQPAAQFASPPSSPSSRPGIMLVRTLLAAAVLIGIVVVFITSGPGESSAAGPERWDAMITAAEIRSDTNNSNASGAPQQQVVNGWHGNDLLTIQAQQNTALLQAIDHSAQIQDRNGKILALLAIGLIGHVMFTAGSGSLRQQRA